MDVPLFNPLDPDFRRDPHPYFHRLRREDPVHFSPVLRLWILTRYADVVAALRDPNLSSNTHHWSEHDRFFCRADEGSARVVELLRHWMLHLDGADHSRLRSLVNQAFVPRMVEAMQPRIRRLAIELLDPLVPNQTMDVVEDFAYPLPIMVIGDLLGIPRQDQSKIKDWSAALLPSLSPALSAGSLQSSNHAAERLLSYFGELIDAKRRQNARNSTSTIDATPANGTPPEVDLLRSLIETRDEANRLTTEELRSTCVLLTFAGHLSTVQLLANAILALGERPDQWLRLRREPSLARGVVEESLRHASPIQWVYRATRDDVVLGGTTIPAGQLVLLSLAAANRDPEQFPEPDIFDITRFRASSGNHVAFGYGRHFCLGAALAFQEAEVALEVFAQRVGDLRVDQERVSRESSLLLRGIRTLPIHFKTSWPNSQKPTA